MSDPQIPAAPSPERSSTVPTVPLTIFFRADEAYAQREQEIRNQQILAAPPLTPAEPVPAEGPKPSVEPPSPIVEGAKAFAVTAFEGAKNIMEGLARGLVLGEPGAPKQALVEGVLPLALSPFVGAAVAAGQGLENLSPEVAGQTVFEGGAAFTFHQLVAGLPAVDTLTPEQAMAFRQPVTVRELIETAVQFGGPKGLAKIVKRAQSPEVMAALKSQRGAIGPPPEPSAFKGAPRPTEPPPVTGEVPAAPAGTEIRLNLGRVTNTESVKAVMADLNRFNAERLAEHRKTKTHAQTIAEAQGRGGLTLDQALTHDPETILLNEADALVLRDLFNGSAAYYDTLVKRKAGGEVLPPGHLKSAFLVAVQLAMLDEAQGRNVARGLEMRKELSQAQRMARKMTPERILAAGNRLGDLESMSDEMLAARTEMLTVEQRASWFRQTGMGLMVGKDILHAAWIQSLLTNPITHSVNLVGTGNSMLFELPERFVSEIVGAVRRDPNGVQIGETAAGLRVMIQAISDGFRLVGKSWRENQAPFEPGGGKGQLPRINAEGYGFSSDTMFGKTIDVLGAGLGSRFTPGGALIAEDAFAKGIIYRMEISALALREGKAENLIGKALETRVRDLETHPTPQMVVDAQDQALLLTLNKQLGPAGQSFMRFANATPGGRVVLPFIRWGTNAAKWFWQRAPILAELSAQNWRDLEAGGAAKDKAIARVLVGHGAAAVIAYEVSQGNITGGGGAEKGLKPFRECPPYSIKSGGGCYPYMRAGGAVGQLMGAIADYVELTRSIPDQKSYDQWLAMGEAIGIASGQVFVNQTAMSGLANALDSIKDPDRNAGKFLAGLARSAVPAGVRSMTRTADDNVVHEVRTMLDAFKSGLPIMVADIPAVRNPVTGEAIHYPSGVGPDMLSPIFFTAKKDSPVFKELVDNKTVLLPVPWHVGGADPKEGRPQVYEPKGVPGVELMPWERDFWITAMTEKARIEGRTLYQALEHLMRPGSDYWKQSRGPGGGREVLIKAVYAGFRDRGEQMLRDPVTGSPYLEAAIKKQERLRIQQVLPVTHPQSPQNPQNLTPGRGLVERLIPSLGR